MLFYFVLLLFLLIPIGFGFGLAVYLKWKYENPTPRPEANEASSAPENILDILKESSVAQDILLAKNKVPEEDTPEEFPQSDSGFIREQERIEPQVEQQPDTVPSERIAENHGELLARVLEGYHEFSPEKPIEAPPKKTPPRITKSTFENIPVYGTVPEELLETHLCMDQELSPATANFERLEACDSFTTVPDSLLNRFEVISPPGAAHLVQTQDAAIAIRKK